MAIVFAGFTVYGARTGNFVVFIDNGSEGVNLQLYTKEDKSDLDTHYAAEPLKKWTNYTYNRLRELDIVEGLGNKNDDNYVGGIDNRYMCFSFMLCNMGEKDVDVFMDMSITDVEEGDGGGDPISALRVLVLEGEPEISEEDIRTTRPLDFGTIYAYPEATEEGKALLAERNPVYRYEPYETTDFYNKSLVFSEKPFYDFHAGEERKYTFVFWLEGQDIECVDNLFGGRLQMRLDIYASDKNR